MASRNRRPYPLEFTDASGKQDSWDPRYNYQYLVPRAGGRGIWDADLAEGWRSNFESLRSFRHLLLPNSFLGDGLKIRGRLDGTPLSGVSILDNLVSLPAQNFMITGTELNEDVKRERFYEGARRAFLQGYEVVPTEHMLYSAAEQVGVGTAGADPQNVNGLKDHNRVLNPVDQDGTRPGLGWGGPIFANDQLRQCHASPSFKLNAAACKNGWHAAFMGNSVRPDSTGNRKWWTPDGIVVTAEDSEIVLTPRGNRFLVAGERLTAFGYITISTPKPVTGDFMVSASNGKKISGRAGNSIDADTSASLVRVSPRESGLSLRKVVNSFPLVGVMFDPYKPEHRIVFAGSTGYTDTGSEEARVLESARPMREHAATPDYWNESGTYRCESSGNYESARIVISADEQSWNWGEVVPTGKPRFMWIVTDRRTRAPYDSMRPIEIRFTNDGRNINLLTTIDFYEQGDLSSGPRQTTLRGSFPLEADSKRAAQVIAAHIGELSTAGLQVNVMPGKRSIRILPDGENTRWVQVFSGLHRAWETGSSRTAPKNKQLVTLEGTGTRSTSIPFKVKGDDESGARSRDFGGKSSVWTFPGADQLITTHGFTFPSEGWKDDLYMLSAETGVVQFGPISGMTGGEIGSVTMATVRFGSQEREFVPDPLTIPESAPYNYVQNSSEVMSPGYPLWVRAQSADGAGRKNTGGWSYTRPVNWGKAQISRRQPHKLFQAVPPGWEAKPSGASLSQWPNDLANSGIYLSGSDYLLKFPIEPSWDGQSEIRNWPIMTRRSDSFMLHNGSYPLFALPDSVIDGDLYSQVASLTSNDVIRLTTFDGADPDDAAREDGMPSRGTYHPWAGNPYAGEDRFSTAIRNSLMASIGGDYAENATVSDVPITFAFKKFAAAMAGNQVIVPVSAATQVSPAKLPGSLRLTSDAVSQIGAAWYKDKVDVSEFDTSFKFRFHKDQASPTSSYADGIAFVIQDSADGTAAIGSGGGNLGYQGIERSIAIEFDNFFNPAFGETSANHVAIQSYGVNPNSTNHVFSDTNFGTSSFGYADIGPNMKDGQEHTVRIRYDGRKIEIYVDNMTAPVLTSEVNIPELIGLTGTSAYVGLTAATGGASNNHDINDWVYARSLEYRSSTTLPVGKPIDVLYGMTINKDLDKSQYSYIFHLRAEGWVGVYDANDAGYQKNETEVWLLNTYCVNSWSNDPEYVHGDAVDVSEGYHFSSVDGKSVAATFAMPFSTHLEYDAIGERMDLVVLDNYLREVDASDDATLAPPNRSEATFSRAKLITETRVFENAVSTTVISELFADVSDKVLKSDEITDGFDAENPWPDTWGGKNRWYNAYNGIAPRTSQVFDLGEVPLVRKNAYLVYNEGDDVRRRQHVVTPIAVISRPTTNSVPYSQQPLGDRGVGPDQSVSDSIRATFGSGGSRRNLIRQVTLEQPIRVDSSSPYVLNFWDFPYPYSFDMLERYDLITPHDKKKLFNKPASVSSPSTSGPLWDRRASDVPDRSRGTGYIHRSGLDIRSDSNKYSMVVFAEFVGQSDGLLNVPQEYCIIVRGGGGVTHTSAANEVWRTPVKLTFPQGQRPVPERRENLGNAGENARNTEMINPLKDARFDEKRRGLIMSPADGFYITRIMGYMYIDMLPGVSWEEEDEFDVIDVVPSYKPEWIWDELITDVRDVTPRTALGEIIRSLERAPADPEKKDQERKLNVQPSTAISAVGVVPDGGSVFDRGLMEGYGNWSQPAPGVVLGNNHSKISMGNEALERYTFYGSTESCSTNHHEAVMRFHLDVGHRAYGQAGRIVNLGMQLFATQKAGMRGFSGQGSHTSWVSSIRDFEDYVALYYGGAAGGPGGAKKTNPRFQDPSSLGLGKTGDPVRDWLQNNWVPDGDVSPGADGNKYASNWKVMAYVGPSEGRQTEELTTWPLFWFDQVNAEARAMHGTPANYAPVATVVDTEIAGVQTAPGSYITRHTLSMAGAVTNGIVADYEDIGRVPTAQEGGRYTIIGQVKLGGEVKGYFTIAKNADGVESIRVSAAAGASQPVPNPAGSNAYNPTNGTIDIQWSATVSTEWPVDDQLYATEIDAVRYSVGQDASAIYKVVDNDLTYDKSSELVASDNGSYYICSYYVSPDFVIYLSDGVTAGKAWPHALLRYVHSQETVSGLTPGTPISITTTTTHGLATGMTVNVSGVVGTTAANGTWTITVTGASSFTLNDSSSATSYVSGGTVGTGRFVNVSPYDAGGNPARVYVVDEEQYFHWSGRPAGFLGSAANESGEIPVTVEEGQGHFSFIEDERYENLTEEWPPSWIDFDGVNEVIGNTSSLLTFVADANTEAYERNARVVTYRRKFVNGMKNAQLSGFSVRTFKLNNGNQPFGRDLVISSTEGDTYTSSGTGYWIGADKRPRKIVMVGRFRWNNGANSAYFQVDGTPGSLMTVTVKGTLPSGWVSSDFAATGADAGLIRIIFTADSDFNTYSDITLDAIWSTEGLARPSQFAISQAPAPGTGFYSKSQGGGWVSGLPTKMPDGSFSVPSPCFPVYPLCIKQMELREYNDQGPVRRGVNGGFPNNPAAWRKMFSMGDATSSSPADWALSGQLARSKARLDGDDAVSIYECDGSYISPSGTDCTEIASALNYKALLANLAQSPDPFIELPNDARGFFAWGDRIYQGSIGNPHRYLELRVIFGNLPMPFIGNAFYDGTPFTGGGRGAYSTQVSWQASNISRPDGFRTMYAPIEAAGTTIVESQRMTDPVPAPGPNELPFVGKLTATPARGISEVLGDDVVSNGDFISGIISGDFETIQANEQKLSAWQVTEGSVKYVKEDIDRWHQAKTVPGPFPDGKRVISLNGQKQSSPEREIETNNIANGRLDGGQFVGGNYFIELQYDGANKDWIVAFELMAPDHTITGATNASPIVITTSTENNYETGNIVNISNVGGNTNANGNWTVTRLTATTFSLNGSNGNSAYTSGGRSSTFGLPNVETVQNGRVDYILPNSGPTPPGTSRAIDLSGSVGSGGIRQTLRDLKAETKYRARLSYAFNDENPNEPIGEFKVRLVAWNSSTELPYNGTLANSIVAEKTFVVGPAGDYTSGTLENAGWNAYSEGTLDLTTETSGSNKVYRFEVFNTQPNSAYGPIVTDLRLYEVQPAVNVSAAGRIAQTITTEPGEEYLLSFKYANDPEALPLFRAAASAPASRTNTRITGGFDNSTIGSIIGIQGNKVAQKFSIPSVSSQIANPGVTNPSGLPYVVTTTKPHGINTGDQVKIDGVGTLTLANGIFTATRLTSTTFSLNGTSGNGGGQGTNGLVRVVNELDKTLPNNKAFVNSINVWATLKQPRRSTLQGQLVLKVVKISDFVSGSSDTPQYSTTVVTSRPVNISDIANGKFPRVNAGGIGVNNSLDSFISHDEPMIIDFQFDDIDASTGGASAYPGRGVVLDHDDGYIFWIQSSVQLQTSDVTIWLHGWLNGAHPSIQTASDLGGGLTRIVVDYPANQHGRFGTSDLIGRTVEVWDGTALRAHGKVATYTRSTFDVEFANFVGGSAVTAVTGATNPVMILDGRVYNWAEDGTGTGTTIGGVEKVAFEVIASGQHSYFLSGDSANKPASGPALDSKSSFIVTAGNIGETFSVDSLQNSDLREGELRFTAQSEKTEISFTSMKRGSSYGAAVTDIEARKVSVQDTYESKIILDWDPIPEQSVPTPWKLDGYRVYRRTENTLYDGTSATGHSGVDDYYPSASFSPLRETRFIDGQNRGITPNLMYFYHVRAVYSLLDDSGNTKVVESPQGGMAIGDQKLPLQNPAVIFASRPTAEQLERIYQLESWAIAGEVGEVRPSPPPPPLPPTITPAKTSVQRGGGLKARYFRGKQFNNLVEERTEPNVSVYWGNRSPLPEINDNFSVAWDGWMKPTVSGTYQIGVAGLGAYAVYLCGKKVTEVDGKIRNVPVGFNWPGVNQGGSVQNGADDELLTIVQTGAEPYYAVRESNTMALQADQYYWIAVHYLEPNRDDKNDQRSGAGISLCWRNLDERKVELLSGGGDTVRVRHSSFQLLGVLSENSVENAAWSVQSPSGSEYLQNSLPSAYGAFAVAVDADVNTGGIQPLFTGETGTQLTLRINGTGSALGQAGVLFGLVQGTAGSDYFRGVMVGWDSSGSGTNAVTVVQLDGQSGDAARGFKLGDIKVTDPSGAARRTAMQSAFQNLATVDLGVDGRMTRLGQINVASWGSGTHYVTISVISAVQLEISIDGGPATTLNCNAGGTLNLAGDLDTFANDSWRSLRGTAGIFLNRQTIDQAYIELKTFTVSAIQNINRVSVSVDGWKEVVTDSGTFESTGIAKYFGGNGTLVTSGPNNHTRAYWLISRPGDLMNIANGDVIEIAIKPKSIDDDNIGFVWGWVESAGTASWKQFDWKGTDENEGNRGYRLITVTNASLVNNRDQNSNGDDQKYIRTTDFCSSYMWNNNNAGGPVAINASDFTTAPSWGGDKWNVFLLKEDPNSAGTVAIYHAVLNDQEYADYNQDVLKYVPWKRLLPDAALAFGTAGRWGIYSQSQPESQYRIFRYRITQTPSRPPIELDDRPGSGTQGGDGLYNPGWANDAFLGGEAGGFLFGPGGKPIPGYTYLPVPGSVFFHDEQITIPAKESNSTNQSPPPGESPIKPGTVGSSGSGRLKKGGLKASYYKSFSFANPGWQALADARSDDKWAKPFGEVWNVKAVGSTPGSPAVGDMWVDSDGLIVLQTTTAATVTLSADGLGSSDPTDGTGFAYSGGNPARMPNEVDLDDARFNYLNQSATASALADQKSFHRSPPDWQIATPCFCRGWAWHVYNEADGEYYRLVIGDGGNTYRWQPTSRPYSMLEGSLVRSVIEPGITHDDWKETIDGVREPGTKSQQNFGVRWEGYIEAPADGPLELMCKFEDGARLWIEDGSTLKVDQYNPGGGNQDFYVRQTTLDWTDVWNDEEWAPIYPPREAKYVTQNLKKGNRYKVRIEYYEQGGYAHAELYWRRPNTDSSRFEIVPAEYLCYEEKYEVPLQPKSPLRLPGINYAGNIRPGGVIAEYFDNKDLLGAPVTRVEPRIDFEWATDGSPSPLIGPETWSARWTGFIQPQRTGLYRFHCQRDDGVRLFLNDQPVIDTWTLAYQSIANSNETGGGGMAKDDVFLEGGRRYKLRMEFFENLGHAEIDLRWSFLDAQDNTVYKISAVADVSGEARVTIPVPVAEATKFANGQYFQIFRALDSNGNVIPQLTGTWKIKSLNVSSVTNGITSLTAILEDSVYVAGYSANSGRARVFNGNTTFSYGVFAPDWKEKAALASRNSAAFKVSAVAGASGETQVSIALNQLTDLESRANITGVTTGASPVVTTLQPHGYSNGDSVFVSEISGMGGVAGTRTVASVTTNTFQLSGATSTGTYGGGGTVEKYSNCGLSNGQWVHIWNSKRNLSADGTYQIKSLTLGSPTVTFVLDGSTFSAGTYAANSGRLSLVPSGVGANVPTPAKWNERFRGNLRAVHEAVPLVPSSRLFYEVDERTTGLMDRGGLGADRGPGAFQISYRDLSGQPLGNEAYQSTQRSFSRSSLLRCKYQDRMYGSSPDSGGALAFWGLSTADEARGFAGSEYVTAYLPYSEGGDHALRVNDPQTAANKPGGQRPTFIGSDRVGIGTLTIGLLYDRDFFGAGPDGSARKAEIVE